MLDGELALLLAGELHVLPGPEGGGDGAHLVGRRRTRRTVQIAAVLTELAVHAALAAPSYRRTESLRSTYDRILDIDLRFQYTGSLPPM